MSGIITLRVETDLFDLPGDIDQRLLSQLDSNQDGQVVVDHDFAANARVVDHLLGTETGEHLVSLAQGSDAARLKIMFGLMGAGQVQMQGLENALIIARRSGLAPALARAVHNYFYGLDDQNNHLYSTRPNALAEASTLIFTYLSIAIFKKQLAAFGVENAHPDLKDLWQVLGMLENGQMRFRLNAKMKVSGIYLPTTDDPKEISNCFVFRGTMWLREPNMNSAGSTPSDQVAFKTVHEAVHAAQDIAAGRNGKSYFESINYEPPAHLIGFLAHVLHILDMRPGGMTIGEESLREVREVAKDNGEGLMTLLGQVLKTPDGITHDLPFKNRQTIASAFGFKQEVQWLQIANDLLKTMQALKKTGQLTPQVFAELMNKNIAEYKRVYVLNEIFCMDPLERYYGRNKKKMPEHKERLAPGIARIQANLTTTLENERKGNPGMTPAQDKELIDVLSDNATKEWRKLMILEMLKENPENQFYRHLASTLNHWAEKLPMAGGKVQWEKAVFEVPQFTFSTNGAKKVITDSKLETVTGWENFTAKMAALEPVFQEIQQDFDTLGEGIAIHHRGDNWKIRSASTYVLQAMEQFYAALIIQGQTRAAEDYFTQKIWPLVLGGVFFQDRYLFDGIKPVQHHAVEQAL